MKKEIFILAIESSCDDTSAAVICNNQVLSNCVFSQEIHTKFGGVVPELASRAHQQKIIPVVHQAIAEAQIEKQKLNAIAFTRGPGLMGSLLVGVSFAKAFGYSLKIPIIDVNHIHAHILAHHIFINSDGTKNKIPTFPYLCLIVSGGHTQIMLVKNESNFQMIGQTLDDAAGEAFDKSAKILGLPYPGGPLIDKLSKNGNPLKFKFPKPLVAEYDYSFSGLKTSFLYFIERSISENPNFVNDEMGNICASIQNAITVYTCDKLLLAAKQFDINQIAVAGGVSANSYLRKYLSNKCEEFNLELFIPRFEYCTDNAAMIGIAAYFKYLAGDFCGLDVSPFSRL